MKVDFSKEPGNIQKKKNKTQKEKALMTIVTPFYNAGTYFAQTYRSVMNQTFSWFEWVIVDDGSDCMEDLKLLEDLAGRDARIRLVHQKNGGLARARNAGIRQAGTDIIVPLDADDLLAPQYLEYTYFGLYFHPEASWCYTDTVGFGRQEYVWRYPWNAGRLKKQNYLTATAAIRRQALQEAGGYQAENRPYYEDWHLWLRLLAMHKYPVHVKGYLFWYRRLSDGMLSGIRMDPERKRFCKKMIAKAAAKADSRVRAVEYPAARTKIPYYRPKTTDTWDNCRTAAEPGQIRILMLIPWMVMGGADRLNLDLVSGLDRKRFQISILTTVAAEHEWQGYFSEYTDEIFHLPDFLDPAHALEYVCFYIRSRAVDVLFLSNSYRGYYMLPVLRRQFPKLCMVDYVHMEEWYWKAGGFARLSGLFGSFLDKTYVSSSATGQVLARDFGREEDRIACMHIGVDTVRFDPDKVPAGRLYRRLGVAKDRPVVLYPCRIDAQKRPFLMLAIAKAVCGRMPEAVFAVVGDGPQRRELERAVRKYRLEQHVICTGPSAHMEECYRDAAVTLICSIKEGLSLTAYESCAMGTPVVSSDVGGQKDLIDSSVGMLVPVRQAEDADFDRKQYEKEEVLGFARAILRLLKDPKLYDTCSANCRNKIRQGFTTADMLKKMEQELESLATENKKPQSLGKEENKELDSSENGENVELVSPGKEENRELAGLGKEENVEPDRIGKKENQVRERRELSKQVNRLGYLAEECYMLELAEEERSMASSALLEWLEAAAAVVLPENSRRRRLAVRFYKEYKNNYGGFK